MLISNMNLEFECDTKKSASNKEKHGIDFEEAKTLWLDGERIEFQVKCEDELVMHCWQNTKTRFGWQFIL